MGLFHRLNLRLKQKLSNTPATPPVAPPTTPLARSQPPSPPTPTAPPHKSLTQLQREMEAEANAQRIYPHPIAPRRPQRRMPRFVLMALLVGLPVGIVWLANLPYPMIRRPVARTVPILLLPSYINIDHHYRLAIASTEQAEQLITQATSFADIELGEQKVEQAQTSLDALPIEFLYDYPDYSYWWYSWRFSRSRFDWARATVGQLEARVFQQKNAQIALAEAEQDLTIAKQQYQQAQTSIDQQQAIAEWRSALDAIAQLPSQTFAGQLAQQKLAAYQRDFQDTVGLAAGNQRIAGLIAAARGFAAEAAQASQNPPHSVEEWRRIEGLWQEAIDRLEQISDNDPDGYDEAQRKLIEYTSSLSQIQVRREQEEQSVRSFESAQAKIQYLVRTAPSSANAVNSNEMRGQLIGIIDELNRVDDGTTVYREAQILLIQAQNKLDALQP